MGEERERKGAESGLYGLCFVSCWKTILIGAMDCSLSRGWGGAGISPRTDEWHLTIKECELRMRGGPSYLT
jgi:hypothetical protein